MNDNAQIERRSSSGRARARVRRVTGGIVIASITLAGTIAGYVAQGATHRKSTGAAASAAPTGVAVPSAPAAPSLLAPGESAPQQPQSIAPPSQAPSATQEPPTAVSGAS
jgi:hypothetical protein